MSRLDDIDRLAEIIDERAFAPSRDFDLDMVERRNVAREKVRLIEIALFKSGWQLPAKRTPGTEGGEG